MEVTPVTSSVLVVSRGAVIVVASFGRGGVGVPWVRLVPPPVVCPAAHAPIKSCPSVTRVGRNLGRVRIVAVTSIPGGTACSFAEIARLAPRRGAKSVVGRGGTSCVPFQDKIVVSTARGICSSLASICWFPRGCWVCSDRRCLNGL